MIQVGFKFSEIDVPRAKKYLNVEDDFVEDDELIEILISAAQDYVLGYTNLGVEMLDNHNSCVVATLMLISDFYEVRTVNLGGEKNSAVNKMLGFILSMYRDLE